MQFGTQGKAVGRRPDYTETGPDQLTALDNPYFLSDSIYIKYMSFK
jgi:hypothetical protein